MAFWSLENLTWDEKKKKKKAWFGLNWEIQFLFVEKVRMSYFLKIKKKKKK
jgi:hypothetical protein